MTAPSIIIVDIELSNGDINIPMNKQYQLVDQTSRRFGPSLYLGKNGKQAAIAMNLSNHYGF